MYWFYGSGLGGWVLETNSPQIVRPWAQDKLQAIHLNWEVRQARLGLQACYTSELENQVMPQRNSRTKPTRCCY